MYHFLHMYVKVTAMGKTSQGKTKKINPILSLCHYFVSSPCAQPSSFVQYWIKSCHLGRQLYKREWVVKIGKYISVGRRFYFKYVLPGSTDSFSSWICGETIHYYLVNLHIMALISGEGCFGFHATGNSCLFNFSTKKNWLSWS